MTLAMRVGLVVLVPFLLAVRPLFFFSVHPVWHPTFPFSMGRRRRRKACARLCLIAKFDTLYASTHAFKKKKAGLLLLPSHHCNQTRGLPRGKRKQAKGKGGNCNAWFYFFLSLSLSLCPYPSVSLVACLLVCHFAGLLACFSRLLSPPLHVLLGTSGQKKGNSPGCLYWQPRARAPLPSLTSL